MTSHKLEHTRNVYTELARLGQLSNANTQRQQIRARHRRRPVGDRQSEIVDSTAVKSEHILLAFAVRRRHEVVQRATAVDGQLGEDRLALFLS